MGKNMDVWRLIVVCVIVFGACRVEASSRKYLGHAYVEVDYNTVMVGTGLAKFTISPAFAGSDGENFVVGAVDQIGLNSVTAWTKSSGSWLYEKSSDIQPQAGPKAFFGQDVRVSSDGSVLFVGALDKIYVFGSTASDVDGVSSITWTQKQIIKLPYVYQNFEVAGNLLVVMDVQFNFAVYKNENLNFSIVQTGIIEEVVGYDAEVVCGLSDDANYFLVGVTYYGNESATGFVVVHNWDGSKFVEYQKISSPYKRPCFGSIVWMMNSKLAISSACDPLRMDGTAATVYVYWKNADGYWEQKDEFTGDDASFGTKIGMADEGDMVFIVDATKLYVYERKDTDNHYGKEQEIPLPDNTNGFLDLSVIDTGDVFVVGVYSEGQAQYYVYRDVSKWGVAAALAAGIIVLIVFASIFVSIVGCCCGCALLVVILVVIVAVVAVVVRLVTKKKDATKYDMIQ